MTDPQKIILNQRSITIRKCDIDLHIQATGHPSSVSVSGEFNDWDKSALTDTNNNGIWSINLGTLSPGNYAYTMLFDGLYEGTPPIHSYTTWSDGFENRKLSVGDCTLPLLQLIDVSSDPTGRIQASIQFCLGGGWHPYRPRWAIHHNWRQQHRRPGGSQLGSDRGRC